MNHRIPFLFLIGIVLTPSASFSSVLIPDLGDMNCDGESNVVDVQLSILSALGLPVNPLLDGDGNGVPDTCQDYADAVSGDCEVGQIIQYNGTVWACADMVALDEEQVEEWVKNEAIDLAPGTTIGGQPLGETNGGGGAGTVIYTRCPWFGTHGKDIGSCDPPACPAGWDDLGVVGNRIVHSTGTGASSGIMDSSYTTTHGNEERGCYHPDAWAVVSTSCSWVGGHGKDFDTCDPPGCPDNWVDLGVTGHVTRGAGTTGASSGIMDSSFTAAHGTQERTCVR